LLFFDFNKAVNNKFIAMGANNFILVCPNKADPVDKAKIAVIAYVNLDNATRKVAGVQIQIMKGFGIVISDCHFLLLFVIELFPDCGYTIAVPTNRARFLLPRRDWRFVSYRFAARTAFPAAPLALMPRSNQSRKGQSGKSYKEQPARAQTKSSTLDSHCLKVISLPP
jgi:hypothetical protein